MESAQRPLPERQQGQEQQPPTTYARGALDRALWNCAADGSLVRNGRHLTEEELGWLVRLVQQDDGGDASTAAYLSDVCQRHQIVVHGPLVGTVLRDGRARLARLERFVQAVRRGQ